jgi:hypothetical protein
MFIRLITKTNHPYNNNPLTLDEFNQDYKKVSDFIDWKSQNPNIKNSFSLYHFTIDRMTSFLQLIRYDTDNKDDLIELWKTKMMK